MENFKHHEFNAEWVDDKSGPAIMLTQSDDGYCEPQTILVHPWQFRATCEHFGILPSGDDEARRTIATLARRLLVLAARIGELRTYVATYSDHEHADLHVEMVMLNSLGDLAAEWATEADGLSPCPVPLAERPREAVEGPQTHAENPRKGKGAKTSANASTGQPELELAETYFAAP